MKHYLNLTQFAEELGMRAKRPGERSRGLQHRWKSGKLPFPDVAVGNLHVPAVWYPGWTRERVHFYRYFTRDLYRSTSEPGTILRPRFDLDRATLPDWWGSEEDVEWFCNVKDIGKLLDLKRRSVGARRRRGIFDIDPAVCVGGVLYGWDQLAVDDYVRQERAHPRSRARLAVAA